MHYGLVIVLGIGGVILLTFLCCALFMWLMNRRMAAIQSDLAEKHYEEVENMYQQMRGWRHDYKHHIQTMKAHAAENDWEAVRAYLDTLETDLATFFSEVKTGIRMADACLEFKRALSRSDRMSVRADASVPVKLNISELDLCVILGNLFDNAIEASLALPEEERLIRVYMDMKGTQLYISCTNFTAAGKRQKTGGLFRSTKGEDHGFGLVRMDAIVERLGGYLSRNSEDGAFTTEILLPVG